ncbi:TKL protein kinase, variant 1 [Aphanomyces astaci]|uniref:TKL protein kinase, variant 1 n=1 Tax=Aphanomyces astaci TaxID=112090 RepID=W4FFP7_APHAT|nr:TKL protein kinase, variant 1 [Aphanomyces astaci]ETV66342.1 TKL protein kinase, variant 1 [Aphanomyces astaci]|eukprot:XP_009844117.1 TKL protein kinase, variant 1 [Aphanomyces astaci]
MLKAGCVLLAGLGVVAVQATPASPALKCALSVTTSQLCLACQTLDPICTPRTNTITVNVVEAALPKLCAEPLTCTYEIPTNYMSRLTCSDPSNLVSTLVFRRAYAQGKVYWLLNNSTFASMNGLANLRFHGGRPSSMAGKDDPQVDYFVVDLNEYAYLPKSLSELTLSNTYTSSLNLTSNSQLMTLNVQGSLMTRLPPTGISSLSTLSYNSIDVWPFPSEVLDMDNLATIDLSHNEFINPNFISDAQFQKFNDFVNTTKLSMHSTVFQDCPPAYMSKFCRNYKSPLTAAIPISPGPSASAITTLVVVSCIASLLVLVAIVVHRRSRHATDMSPGALNSNSPDDDFYGIDEVYATTQTMSKFKTAGANDASLTKIPAADVQLARCLGGDIWMGEMETANVRIVLRRAPRFAGDHVTDSFFQGVKEMARLSHPNLVTYMGVTCLSGTDIYAVAEFMDKGSLISVYQAMPLTWEVQLDMATDVVEAIHYLHTLMPIPVPVEHLRSSNILVSSSFACKLNIFNFMASYKASTMCKEMYGNNQLAWRAPEVLKNEMHNFLAADMYSLGVVLAEIGTATRPFDREISEVGTVHTDVWMVDSVMAGKGVPLPYDPKSSKWMVLPEEFQKLVHACLHLNPTKRPNSGIVLQRLKTLKMEGIEL